MPILAIIGSLVPGLVRHFFGPAAAEVAEMATNAATEIFGSGDPQHIERSIAKDPALALQFKAKLLDIQDNAAKREHELRLKEIEDVQSARGMYSQSQRVVNAMTLITVVMFFAVNGAVMYGLFLLFTDPPKNFKITEFTLAAATMAGSILTYVNQKGDIVWGFFFGSSKSSQEKTEAMSLSLTNALKTGVAGLKK